MKNSESTIIGAVTGLVAVALFAKFVLNREPKHLRQIKRQIVAYRKVGKIIQMIGRDEIRVGEA